MNLLCTAPGCCGCGLFIAWRSFLKYTHSLVRIIIFWSGSSSPSSVPWAAVCDVSYLNSFIYTLTSSSSSYPSDLRKILWEEERLLNIRDCLLIVLVYSIVAVWSDLYSEKEKDPSTAAATIHLSSNACPRRITNLLLYLSAYLTNNNNHRARYLSKLAKLTKEEDEEAKQEEEEDLLCCVALFSCI